MAAADHIPMEELRADLIECERDIIVCEYALEHGVTTYGPDATSVQWRLDENVRMAVIIRGVLARREARDE